MDCKCENIRVVVRVRPDGLPEKTLEYETVASVDEFHHTITLFKPNTKIEQKTFKFDYVFLQESTQVEVYQEVALPIVEQVLKGYNGSIFAYGQTGSGKTYTMIGESGQPGIICNTVSHIFGRISKASAEESFVVTATYLEIYNEEVRDLLSPHRDQKLDVRERTDIGIYVKGLTGFSVDSTESILKLLERGNSNRAKGATFMNNVSSRSHAIFTITIEARNQIHQQTTVAKLNLVDLAGSERLVRTRATGGGLKEATSINQSLFVLRNVISALTEENITHIPYRNSKLTRLLQNSLGGNSKTAIIATVSASSVDYQETLCTLHYISRAKLIKNRVQANLKTEKGLIEHFENEITRLKKQLSVISLQEDEVLSRKYKQLEKRLEKDRELAVIENAKSQLQHKLRTIKNKILTGGTELLNKAQEQRFLLELSFEEITKLDQSRQELEELLDEKETVRFDLEDQYVDLQEEDSVLDKKLKKMEQLFTKTAASLQEQKQEYQFELKTLSENAAQLRKELQLTFFIVQNAIPKNQLALIMSHVKWNPKTCDFQVSGVQHLGNNIKRRRFKKHVQKSLRLQRKAFVNKQPGSFRASCRPNYQSYPLQKSKPQFNRHYTYNSSSSSDD